MSSGWLLEQSKEGLISSKSIEILVGLSQY